MFNKHVYGIDLGSGTIKIFSKKNNNITKERNMIAIRQNRDVIAVGQKAYEMYEKNPQDIEVSYPMANGMIANINQLDVVLQTLLAKTDKTMIGRPTVYFAVPMDMTEIEKRAYYAIARHGRFKRSRILLVERPIADALALGIPISKTKGSMIVNIGAQSTEISVIADNRVIISKLLTMGGYQFNQNIVHNIRRKNNFQISMRTAGRLKGALADLKPEIKSASKIFGIDCVSGLPRSRVVTSNVINEAIYDSVIEIGKEIRSFLERIPPQIHKVVLQEGIYITGGSTKIKNIDKILSEQLGCPVILSRYYEFCTIYGLKEIATHDSLKRWAFTPKRQKR